MGRHHQRLMYLCQVSCDALSTIPPGVTNVVVTPAACTRSVNYHDMPISVEHLVIEYVPSVAECASLPTHLETLIIWGKRGGNDASVIAVPKNLRHLTINCSNLVSVVGFPDSLESFIVTGCPNLASIAPLPYRMKKVEVGGSTVLDNLDYLPRQLDELVLSELPALKTLDGVHEVGTIRLHRLSGLTSYSAINPGTKIVITDIQECKAPLSTLRGPIPSLSLYYSQYDVDVSEGAFEYPDPYPVDDPAFASVEVECMGLADVDFPLSNLPRSLRSLSIDGTAHENLIGLPEDLESLSVNGMEFLTSWAGVPPCIQHMTVENVVDVNDFPLLYYLDSLVIDEITTVEMITYTDGEDYMEDAKCPSKRPSTMAESGYEY